MKLKNISEQTIVITGATSGIGLTTALMAAEQGAKLLLIARNYDALRRLTDEINSNGGRAISYAADVADERALRDAAKKAKDELGGFDTWVNNAGGAIYGKIADVSNEDSRRLFETNFWGVVYGSRIAVEHLKEKGGTLINIGSEVSDIAVPLIGMYSTSKHAVKGFTDAFRMEIEADKLPISVTLIKPTAIHTPFPEHSKNYMDFEPQLPPPVYAPELVAEAILHCAQNQVRDFFVGEMAAAHSALATYAPRLTDKFMEMTGESQQNSGKPSDPNRPDGLYETHSDLRERGSEERYVLETSIYQKAKIHPVISGAIAIGAGLGIAALIGSRSKSSFGKR
jgi:short-subunit dehydrogenase